MVNNSFTDETDQVLEKYSNILPIRRLFEAELGLSHARNRVLDVASGDLLVWTDDDVSVDKDWLVRLTEASKRWTHAAVFGGKILPEFEKTPPRWLVQGLPVISTSWALLDLGINERKFWIGEVPFGANLAFRTSIKKNIVLNKESTCAGDTRILSSVQLIFNTVIYSQVL